MEHIYTIKLTNGATYQARGEEELGLQYGKICIIRKDFYVDWGELSRKGNTLEAGKGAEIPLIVNQATPEELKQLDAVIENERIALRSSWECVRRLNLDMKLLNAHYSFDQRYLLIQFTADGRIDFRELVKELSRILNTRIELRQIGVRDESAIHGGISVCGQTLCCARFLKEFNSINVKMAKEQDLSLTPANISGVCSRLKCCLKYEHEGYLELEKTMPRVGEWCETESGRGRICDRNLLTQKVTVQLEGGSQAQFERDEIRLTPHERRNHHNGDHHQPKGGNNLKRRPRGEKNGPASPQEK